MLLSKKQQKKLPSSWFVNSSNDANFKAIGLENCKKLNNLNIIDTEKLPWRLQELYF